MCDMYDDASMNAVLPSCHGFFQKKHKMNDSSRMREELLEYDDSALTDPVSFGVACLLVDLKSLRPVITLSNDTSFNPSYCGKFLHWTKLATS